MAATASNGVRYLPAVLGIDIGSTETRLVILWHDGTNIQRIYIENRHDTNTPLNSASQFSSRVLVHDDNEVKYIGNTEQADREESSVKFLTYIISEMAEELEKQYPILDRLRQEEQKVGKRDFHDRLEDAFNQFLAFVLEGTKRALETHSRNGEQIQITTIAMTIPSQWDLTFEATYRRLFMRAFLQIFSGTPLTAPHGITVVFHTEITALAYYLFDDFCREIAFGGGMPDIRTILSKYNAQCLIDCGGHNANSTLTHFERNKDGQPVLYEYGTPQGAGGGSEMLLHDLLAQLIEKYRVKYKDQAELPQCFYQDLKQRTTAILKLMKGASDLITCEHPRGGSRVFLEITREMCDQAFETGFRHVKAMIESQLKELVAIKEGWGAEDHIVTTIVSGGSSQHPKFDKWIRALCTKLKLPEPLFTKNMEIYYRIALGGALASLNQQSVAAFAEKCAFGLQKGSVEEQGQDDEHVKYEGSAETVWYEKRGMIPVTVDARDARGNQTEIRIVCIPFLETFRSDLPTDRSVASGSTYDFLDIGTLPGNYKHRIELTLDIEKEQVEIRICSIPKPKHTAREKLERKAAKKEKVLRLIFPVHVQPGTRSLLIQQSSGEIDQQLKTSMRDFRYRGGIDSDDTNGDDTSDEDDDDDDDDGFIPGPPSPGLSPSLGNSGRAQGSNSHRRSNASEGHDEVQDGDNNDTQLGNLFSSSPHHAADSHEDLESNTAEDRSEAPATNASTSTNKASSTPRGSIASKHETARVTNNAFRLSKDVSGRATSDSQPGFGAPVGKLTSTSSAHTGQGTMPPRNSISSSAGETSSSRPMGSSSMAPESRASASTSASTSRKRPAPSNSDEARPTKRTHTSGGPSSGSADTPRQHAPPREPGRYQEMASSVGPRPAAYSGYGRGEGNASSSRQRPTAAEARRDPPARRDYSTHRPSAGSGSYSDLQRPGRRGVGSQGFEFSDRYRDRDFDGPASRMAGLNLNHNPSPSRPRPARPAPPPPSPPRRGDTAAGWTPPAGSFNSRHFQPNNQRQGSSSRSARNSGPAGSPQRPQGFNGSRRGNRDRPTRDEGKDESSSFPLSNRGERVFTL